MPGRPNKPASIEAQLRKAREAIYQEQEEARRGWLGDQGAQLDAARQQAHELIHNRINYWPRKPLAAKSQLAGTANDLADKSRRHCSKRTAA